MEDEYPDYKKVSLKPITWENLQKRWDYQKEMERIQKIKQDKNYV